MERPEPRFDAGIPPGGYGWWYLDALSDDGQHGLVVIAFIGSVFSPYYAWARQRCERDPARGAGTIDPLNFCAVNVALYGPGSRKRWAMTERGAAQVHRESHWLQIGRSALHWQGDALRVELDETTSPWPSRLRGSIVLHPSALPTRAYTLSEAGSHLWRPIAPCARAEVVLAQPGLRWSGSAYLDHNRGDRPLEQDFRDWSWLRGSRRDGGASLLYDANRRAAEPLSLALSFDRHGDATPFTPPPLAALPTTGWRIARQTRSDAGSGPVELARTLEDTPFYARSLVRTQLQGEPMLAMLENLSLDRFAAPWVRCLLPFRMPRRSGSAPGGS